MNPSSCSGRAPLTTYLDRWFVVSMLAALPCIGASADYVPVKWTKFVKVDGQPEPVPEQWLQDEEARIAHSLNLPDSVPKPVPFNFTVALFKQWLPGTPRVAVQYFNHLCETEAGEWIFRKVEKVEGLYFARPQGPPTSDTLADPFGPEMPWIQRIFFISGDSVKWQGISFVNPPFYNYRFVEQPRRTVNWQASISEPYVRLFGFTQTYKRNAKYWEEHIPGAQPYIDVTDKDPMLVTGTGVPTALYAYTWRGLKRARDREQGVAGGELLIYDMQTKEVLAVRRQFLIASEVRKTRDKAAWEIAARCPIPKGDRAGGEFTQFALDVLQTVEPSSAIRR